MKSPILYISFIFFLLTVSRKANAQTEQYSQFWNEYAFVKNLHKDWSLEGDIGLTTSSIPEDNNMFYGIIQFYVRGWAHYYPNDRWKLTAGYSLIYNRNVPELNQEEAPELRTSLQATYILLKKRTRGTLRVRLEDRHLRNDNGSFEAVARLRFQGKVTYPINHSSIQTNTIYTFLSDEVMFKSKSGISGSSFFDRNRVMVGLGYSFPGDMQLELAYANENLPRNDRTEIYHAFQLKVIFTDIIKNLINASTREKTSIDTGNGP